MPPQYIIPRANSKNLTGRRFGKLVVLGAIGRTQSNKILWLCQCDCGNQAEIQTSNLQSGHTQSCGCARVEGGLRRIKNITGQKFGRLTVTGMSERKRGTQRKWICLCECGNITEVVRSDLLSGNTKSCGCLNIEKRGQISRTHGMTKHPLYRTWVNMITRCENSNNRAYQRYGKRGIEICNEWRISFPAFLDHVSKLEHYGEEGFTLDRIDNDKGYEPGNLRWNTLSGQARNRHDNHLLTHQGKTQTIAAWADEVGLKYQTLWRRLKSGWSIERSLSVKLR